MVQQFQLLGKKGLSTLKCTLFLLYYHCRNNHREANLLMLSLCYSTLWCEKMPWIVSQFASMLFSRSGCRQKSVACLKSARPQVRQQQGLQCPADPGFVVGLTAVHTMCQFRCAEVVTFKWKTATQSVAVSLPCRSFVKPRFSVGAVGCGQLDAWVQKRWSNLSCACWAQRQ